MIRVRSVLPGFLLPFLFFFIPALARAQTVTGVVTNVDTGEPVAGAFVVLVNDAGERAAGVLTDANGSYQVRAPAPGTYRLRVEMIGYRLHTSDPVELGADARLARPIAMAFEPVVLEGIEARVERRRCVGGVPPATGATAELWSQAERALAMAKMTGETERYRFRSVYFLRKLEPGTFNIQEERSEVRVLYGTTPFRSIAPDEAARGGFVRDTAGSVVFYAPDLPILLSDEFLETHCLSVRASSPDDPDLIGLAFEPVDGRQVGELRGVLWLHRRTAELRSMEYGYVNVPWRLSSEELGGRLEFTRLPNGRWIISSYVIRTPYLGTWRLPLPGRTEERRVVTAVQEEGTRVEDVLDAQGRLTGWLGQGTFQGMVYDSTLERPLRGATVALFGTDYRAVTDAAGRFRMPGIAPGDYVATFRHPRRVELGYDPPPVPVTVEAGGVDETMLAIPSGVTPEVAGLVVGGDMEVEVREGLPLPAHIGSWLTGRVVDAGTEEPVPDVEVQLGNEQQVTDTAGWFRFTDLRAGEHTVTLRHIGYGESDATLQLPAWRELIVRFKLPPRPLVLEEVRATATPTEIRTQLASGVAVHAIERGELQELGLRGGQVGDVAYQIPGINVFYGRMYGPGHEDRLRYIACIRTTRPFATLGGGRTHRMPWCEMVDVWMDGVQIPNPGEVLVHANLNEFERIEYVPALGAARWGLHATETGVLLLWTRRR